MSRTPRHPQLEDAIVRDPESPDAYLVYGDWLLEQGDDLGELVSVQAALAKGGELGELASRERALLAEHGRRWVGHFARYTHSWRFGFLGSLVVPEPTRVDCEELLDLVAARFLRDLELEVLGHRAVENCDLISALVELGVPPILRRLALVASGNPRSVDVGSVRALWRRLARIEDLVIQAGNIGLGEIELPLVETVALTTNATPETLDALTSARWPRLRSLSLTFTTYPYEGVDVSLFEPLLDALATLGSVRHLELAHHWVGDAMLERLIASPLLGTLTSVSLPWSAITDAGGRLILEHQAAFARLTSLQLTHNQLGATPCEALQKAFGERIQLASQGAPDAYGEERYDEIEE